MDPLELQKFMISYVQLANHVLKIISNLICPSNFQYYLVKFDSVALSQHQLDIMDNGFEDQKIIIHDVISSYHRLFELWRELLSHLGYDPAHRTFMHFEELRIKFIKESKSLTNG